MGLKFCNLHGHDGASVFDGIGSPDDLAMHCLANAGEDSGAFSINNHGCMNSIGYAVAAAKKYKEKNLKIIHGLEAYYLPSLSEWNRLKSEKDQSKKEEKESEDPDADPGKMVIENEAESKAVKNWADPLNRRNHIVINAINNKGLENLFQLVSKSYRLGFYRKPRIDLEMLKEHNEGLMISTACISGIPAHTSSQHKDKPLDFIFEEYDKDLLPVLDVFGKDRAFLEIQFNKLDDQRLVNDHLIAYSKKTGYKLLATCDNHYASREQWRSREIYKLLGRQQQGQQMDKSILDKTVDELECELYLKNGDEMLESYRKSYKHHMPDEALMVEAIERSYDIAHNLIGFVSPDPTPKLPKLSTTDKSDFDTLEEICLDRLIEINKHEDEEYISRLDLELDAIKERGVAGYFLTVREVVNTLSEHMMTGPGRGSAAGSLVCYLAGITQVDPIPNKLIWERFYSKGRKDLPDIDCLHQNTKIQTPAGAVSLSEISVGDVVFDIDGNSETVLAKRTRRSRLDELVYHVFVEDDGVLGCIVCSENHKLIRSDRSIVLARDVNIGDSLSPNSKCVSIFKNIAASDFVDISISGQSRVFQMIPFPVLEIQEEEYKFLSCVTIYNVDLDIREIDYERTFRI